MKISFGKKKQTTKDVSFFFRDCDSSNYHYLMEVSAMIK
jgi:hypothetical protein